MLPAIGASEDRSSDPLRLSFTRELVKRFEELRLPYDQFSYFWKLRAGQVKNRNRSIWVIPDPYLRPKRGGSWKWNPQLGSGFAGLGRRYFEFRTVPA